MMKPLRVVIVEDSEDDTELVLRELRRGGYDPIHVRVETAEAMTGALGERAWDIVLSDFTLPNFDAFNALAQLHKSGQDIPFIIISGTIGEDRAVTAMKAGAHDYIMKDNLKRLVPATERELRESGMRAERKRAEDACRLQGAALNAAANAMFITDRNGSVEWVNPAFTALTGYSAEEALGTNLWSLVKSGVNDRLVYEELWDTVLGGSVWQGETRSRRKDGSWYPEFQTITPVKDDSGTAVHFIAVMRDLTTEKHLQTQVRVEETLRESIQFKDEFVGLVSHELRTPLTVVTGLSHSLLQGRLGSLENSVHETVDEIHSHSLRLQRVVEDMLVISRLAIGQLAESEPQILDRLVADTLAEFDRRFLGLKVVYQAERELPIVEANETYLRQILWNLLTNAAKYAAGGPIEVIARKRADGAFAEVLVRDRGPGVPEEDISRIFEPYFRSESTKGSAGGLGLGLSVCARLARAQGGELWASRRDGGGMIFGFSVQAARY